MGFDFLKHIQRTKVLIHLIEANPDPSICFDQYKTINKELNLYKENLLDKKTVVAISKSDIISADQLDEIMSYFSKHNIKTFGFSSFTSLGISDLIDNILLLTSQDNDFEK